MNTILTKKFNDVCISVRSVMDLSKEDITKLHILTMMLRSKTEKMPTRQIVGNVLSNAYGMRASFGVNAYGKNVVIENRFEYIHSSWIDEDSYLDEVIEIMDEFLFHTLLDEASFEEGKYLLKNKLMRNEDDPDSLAIRTAYEAIEDSSISILTSGYMEQIDDLQLEDVIDIYKQYVSKPRHVFAVGNVEDKVMDYLNSIDCGKKIQVQYSVLDTDKQYIKVIEKDISQTSLAQIYQTGVVANSEEYYALSLMSSVLGQSPSSLLFKEVREKNSLCYSISSSLVRFDGAMLIQTGTFEEALDQVQELIQQLIQKIIDQDISEEELEIAKMDMIDGMISGQDSPSYLMYSGFLKEILNRKQDAQGVIEKIKAVSIEDIARVAAKLRLVSTAIVKEAN